jgi:allophanate hydrolase
VKFIELGDDMIEVLVPDSATARIVADHVRGGEGLLEVVPGLDRVAVLFDPLAVDPAWICEALASALDAPVSWASPAGGTITLRVRYGGDDGPDLDAVARGAAVSPAALVARHVAALHTAEMIGFTPGFAYLAGIGDLPEASRLTSPRSRVPPGSVGIISGYTGLYALPGPGGWPIIGRVLTPLFDATAAEPFRIKAGSRIRFEPAT